MIKLQKKAIKVKDLIIGGGAQISVQTMTNTLTEDLDSTIQQIARLEDCGADIIRVSIPNHNSVKVLAEIVKLTKVPIVADIHYDYRLAIASIEAGAHKIRINPSNIKSPQGIKTLARMAGDSNIPIRIGFNQGAFINKLSPDALISTMLDQIKIIEDSGCSSLVLAVKCSDIATTIASYRKLYELTNYPLHIGLTEAGAGESAIIKSSMAIGTLLMEGIGDTIRVSLAGDPAREVYVGRRILQCAGIDKSFVEVIACPTCARTSLPVEKIAIELENKTKHIRKQIKIAVMGCSVNGIGEAGNADFGVCGGLNQSIIFKNGKRIKTINNQQIIAELLNILKEYTDG
ncbi:MAG: flavodoxin-dependent (E)-4-hydroxy-3-methylbut-2-enyl-diphosphate synthase [Christensenellaceae bacterium]|jgi:(E)-4-hydroxy-3-methylbut-2-enyl-diphosphate synthase|nr:flavodoxin-dependent (E)-4-hydroxy-3-methylbut-2-enyl-diphosphate synthase [Christensenellaceae bacterium]